MLTSQHGELFGRCFNQVNSLKEQLNGYQWQLLSGAACKETGRPWPQSLPVFYLRIERISEGQVATTFCIVTPPTPPMFSKPPSH